MDMTDFKKAMEHFVKLDLDNFSGTLSEGFLGNNFIETRIRKKDGNLCIIMYHNKKVGYSIFPQEN